MHFQDKIESIRSAPLKAKELTVLQVNVGYRCNMTCKHCHVQAGPHRDEMMSRSNIELVLGVLAGNPITTLDITGGAPELNPHFRHLIAEAARYGKHITVRSNLTIFFEKGFDDIPTFYREYGVEVIASFPYYFEENVDRVRGAGSFRKSIEAIRKLNELGYGNSSGQAVLNLVYNPQGAFLPASQDDLEQEYRRHLSGSFGISFNKLYAFMNMPVGRFRDFLLRSGGFERYIHMLKCSFNAENLEGIMCRRLINVGWDGSLFDCDFNQMIGLAVSPPSPASLEGFDHSALSSRTIAVGDHCYGCVAGRGAT